jgi:hypothetical protein
MLPHCWGRLLPPPPARWLQFPGCGWEVLPTRLSPSSIPAICLFYLCTEVTYWLRCNQYISNKEHFPPPLPGPQFMNRWGHSSPSPSFCPSPLTDLTRAPYWLLACNSSFELRLDFQNHSVQHLQRWFCAHQLVAYHSPSGRQVDCFISKCYNLLWLVDCIYVLGYIPLSIKHCSIHTTGVWERLEHHNRRQRMYNKANQQGGD